MSKSRLIALTGLIGILIGFSLGLYAGHRLFTPPPGPSTTVNAQSILTALHDRGFLVTETVVFDTPVTIDRSTGSAFKDFFLGQTIDARGTMEVNLGIDLAKVTQDDVAVDDASQTVTVRIPAASLFNTRLVGPIELKNRQGILKSLLNADDGYNEALTALSQAAEKTAQTDDLLQRADEHAREDVAQLLNYVVRGMAVKVETK